MSHFLDAIVAELEGELSASTAELDALSPSEGDYQIAIGRLAERRGRLVSQLPLVAGMLKRERARGDTWRRMLSAWR